MAVSLSTLRQPGQPESDTHYVQEPTPLQYSNNIDNDKKTEQEVAGTDFPLNEWDEEEEIYCNVADTNRIGDDASTCKPNMFSYMHDISISSSPELNFSVHTPNVPRYGFSTPEYGENDSSYPVINKDNVRPLFDRSDFGNSFRSPTRPDRERQGLTERTKEVAMYRRKPTSRGN